MYTHVIFDEHRHHRYNCHLRQHRHRLCRHRQYRHHRKYCYIEIPGWGRKYKGTRHICWYIT